MTRSSRRTILLTMAVLAALLVPIVAFAAPWGGGGGWGMMGGWGQTSAPGTTPGGGYGGMMGGGAGGFGGMMGGGAGGAFGGMGFGMMGSMWTLHETDLTAAATALGMTEDDLTKALASGQTVEQLAAAKGLQADAVWAAINTARKAALDAQVAAGTLTQAQADALLSTYQYMGPMTLYGGAIMRSGGCHGTPAGPGGARPTSI